MSSAAQQSPTTTPPQTTAQQSAATTSPQKQHWFKQFPKILLTSAGIVVIIAHFLYRHWTLDSYVASQFQHPSIEELIFYNQSGVVDRPQLEQRLDFLLSNATGHYVLVWGENGVGKTSTMLKVTREKLRPRGVPVFYIVAKKEMFEYKLANALGIYPSHLISIIFDNLKLKFSKPSTEFLLDTLDRAARLMKQRSGFRPVLVIDACNDLEHTTEGSKFLEIMQDWGKKEADANGMNVVFMSSDGKAPVTLHGRGVSSRMISMRVHEATDDEAREYLKLNKDVHDTEEQDRVITITGGVFKYLVRYPELDMVNVDITTHFKRHDFSADNPGFISASRSILNQGKIRYLDFVRAFDSNTKADEALKTNAFLYDPTDDMVSFQNRATRYFVSEMLATVDTKKKEEEAMQLAKKKEEEAMKKEEFMKLVEEEEKALQIPSLITICRTILDKDSIPFENFVDMVGGFDEAHQVLKGLMFVLDSKDQRVTFQSIITRRRLAQKLASIDEKKDEEKNVA